jgi:hypothetical protein
MLFALLYSSCSAKFLYSSLVFSLVATSDSPSISSLGSLQNCQFGQGQFFRPFFSFYFLFFIFYFIYIYMVSLSFVMNDFTVVFVTPYLMYLFYF